ncbi:hypothetical protein [Sorangium sp. So ce1151]|uniref:hypothetical protein n=1 Tax=Sorangium sp. So ce1151 TaxID=3133332 RepID=UPI003F5F73A7
MPGREVRAMVHERFDLAASAELPAWRAERPLSPLGELHQAQDRRFPTFHGALKRHEEAPLPKSRGGATALRKERLRDGLNQLVRDPEIRRLLSGTIFDPIFLMINIDEGRAPL